MDAIVEFVDGYICKMEKIHIMYPLFYFRWDGAYLIVPCKDVVKAVVPMEDFQKAQKDAKSLPIPKAPKPTIWKEVKE